jgi:RND family efflux transporter MFP subunit
MKKYMKFIVPAIAVIFIVLVAMRIRSSSSSSETRRLNAPLVRLEQPQRQTVRYELEFQGDVLPIQQANIFSKVGGNLDRVYVDMGTFVHQNQLLALIDTIELYQTYQQTAATYENAKLNYERTKELSEQNLVAKQDLDNAEAQMKVARANFETAQTHLEYARITAPFTGYITKRFLDPGALVNQNNSTLFTLMDLNAMKIIINVLEKDIPLVSIGTKAIVTVDAFPDKEFYGTVARLSNALDLSTRTMAVEIDIPNENRFLKPGMYANVDLVVQNHANALTVPTQAVLKDGRGNYVFTIRNGTAVRKDVSIGLEQSSRTEILSGIADADSIIVTGQQFVKDGARVNVQS